MKSAFIRALKQTQEGLQSLKDSPRYAVVTCPDLLAQSALLQKLHCYSVLQGPVHCVRYQCL